MLWNGWISLYRLYLGMKCKVHAPKFSSPLTQKPGCDDGGGVWIPISTFSNHSLCLWWHIGRVRILCIAWISQHPHNLGLKSKHGPIQIYVPSPSWKICCDNNFCAHIPISTMSNHSLYLCREIGRVEMMWNGWISLYMLYLGMKCRGHAPKISSPLTQKPGCGDGCGGWIPISTATMSNC